MRRLSLIAYCSIQYCSDIFLIYLPTPFLQSSYTPLPHTALKSAPECSYDNTCKPFDFNKEDLQPPFILKQAHTRLVQGYPLLGLTVTVTYPFVSPAALPIWLCDNPFLCRPTFSRARALRNAAQRRTEQSFELVFELAHSFVFSRRRYLRITHVQSYVLQPTNACALAKNTVLPLVSGIPEANTEYPRYRPVRSPSSLSKAIASA